MIRVIVFYFCLLFCCFAATAQSAEQNNQDVADSAVANILFDYDGSSEFASYTVNSSGFVDITFARDIPDKLYGEILTKMQNSKEISGVLSSKTGPICGLW